MTKFLPNLQIYIDTPETIYYLGTAFTANLLRGVVAQLGERMAGSHEVRGSIPLSSTTHSKSVSQHLG